MSWVWYWSFLLINFWKRTAWPIVNFIISCLHAQRGMNSEERRLNYGRDITYTNNSVIKIVSYLFCFFLVVYLFIYFDFRLLLFVPFLP